MIGALRSPAADLVAAAIFAAIGFGELLLGGPHPGPLGGDLAAAAAIAGAVALRRRAPARAAVAYLAATLSMALWLTPPPELTMPFFGLLLFPYAVGSRRRLRVGAPLMAGMVAMVLAVEAIPGDVYAGDVLFPSAFAVAAFLAGRGARSRTRLAAELHEAALLAQEEREAQAAAAVLAERRRIAREMHDVVAHSISVMVVQAGGARRILEQEPQRAAEAAGEIERTGREALVEMRRLLGVLRPQDGAAAREPQPGLGALGPLLERARTAGLPVTMREEGTPRELPAGVDLAAYRIVQEALTNALTHARAARTEVLVRWGARDVELEIADRGPGPAPFGDDNGDNDGHGLIGMRERARLYGGELSAGRRRGGGFEVKARLPVEPEEVA